MNIIGKWYDRWLNTETGEEVCYSGENQIQNACGTLLATLCSNDPGTGSFGISYMACGSGESGWDSEAPEQSYDQTTLTNEIYRQATWYYVGGETPYFVSYFYYIDPDTFTPSGSPTRALEGEIVVAAGNATGTHREFGLFGGDDADSDPDTGYMINWVVIPVHNKGAAEELTRTIRLFISER